MDFNVPSTIEGPPPGQYSASLIGNGKRSQGPADTPKAISLLSHAQAERWFAFQCSLSGNHFTQHMVPLVQQTKTIKVNSYIHASVSTKKNTPSPWFSKQRQSKLTDIYIYMYLHKIYTEEAVISIFDKHISVNMNCVSLSTDITLVEVFIQHAQYSFWINRKGKITWMINYNKLVAFTLRKL